MSTNEPQTAKLAAIYCRISQDREGEALGVARQEEDARELAACLGYRVTEVYTDNDRSASTRTKKKRPRYDAMLTAARRGEFQAVISYSNSRLTRRPRELEDLIELHEHYGVRFHTVVSGDDDLSTADGRMVARLKGSIDAAEAERTAERVTRAARQAAEAGKWHGGRRPFGFEPDGLTIREDEAEVIREGYRAIVAGGSLRSVMRLWNARGLFAAKGANEWSLPSVRSCLKSPRYIGKRTYRGEIVADAEWPAIVDVATWEAVHAILTDPARKQGQKAVRYLLSGIARCGICGSPIVATGGRKGHPAYRCGKQAHILRTAEPMDDYVSRVALRRLQTREVAEALTEHIEKPDTGALREKLQALRIRLDQLAVEFADGTLTASQLRAATRRLREQIERTEEQLATVTDDDVLGPIVSSDDIEARWNSLDVDTKRTAIDTLMAITFLPAVRGSHNFDPNSVRIEWKGAK